MSIDAFVTARDRLLAADRAEQPVDAILRELLDALHQCAAFAAAALLLTDTETLLPFGGIVEGFDNDGCVPFWDNELLDPDFNKFNVLARSNDPVATLWDATDGDLDRSPRFHKIYEPYGHADELRVAFASGERCWAVAALGRPRELGPFAQEEIQAVRDLVPIAARAVRSAVIRRDGSFGSTPPTVLIVRHDSSIESATPGSDGVLQEFLMPGVALDVPTPVLAAARRAKNSRSASNVTLRARGVSGRWFRLHASPLGDDRVAVVIEPAPPADLIPMLLESYGLSSRESEVVPLVARGLSTKQIAAELCISRHTVSDHIKLIFDKCGVTSRGELVAKVFTEHLLPGHKASTSHV